MIHTLQGHASYWHVAIQRYNKLVVQLSVPECILLLVVVYSNGMCSLGCLPFTWEKPVGQQL